MSASVSIGSRTMPLRQTHLTIADFDDSLVVLDQHSKQVHLLEGVAAVVFDACDGATDHDAVATDIAIAFGAPVTSVEQRIEILLRSFASLGLLEGTEPEAEPPCIGCGPVQGGTGTRRRITRRGARRYA